MEQMNIFECLYPDYKLDKNKPLYIIEAFAGYGSQSLALKYLGVKYEHQKSIEWAIPSIIAYASLHRNELKDYGKDFTDGMNKDAIAEELFKLGVSSDYQKPAELDQLKRMSEDRLRLCYNSVKWSNNLVDICRVKGCDLQIEREREYLLSYSFPCQCLSLAGKLYNLASKDKITEDNLYATENRSNMLWQVGRILKECEVKPTILLCENVPMLHSQDNMPHLKEWLLTLEKLGYTSYWFDLSATECLIPQTRVRTFVVSILGNYNYNIQKANDLKLKLKDLLEKNVDKKYYLSEEKLEQIKAWKSYQNPLDSVLGNESVCPTITTRIAESDRGGDKR
jgi:DNA (cytosine-5)-methyltransferase 1